MAGYAAIPKAQWGTYRPNATWVRKHASPTLPCSVCYGTIPTMSQRIRHDAEERDKLSKWGWTHHDGNTFGVQELIDPLLGVNWTTQFIRTHGDDGSFVLRMHGEPTTNTAKPKKGATAAAPVARNISLVWYAAMENPTHTAVITDMPRNKRGIDGSVELRVETGGTASPIHTRLPSFTVRAPRFETNTYTKVTKTSGRARTVAKEEPLDKV